MRLPSWARLCAILIALGLSASAQDARNPPGLRDVVDPSAAPPPPPAPKTEEEATPAAPPELDPMAAKFKRVSQLMMVTLEGANGPTDADRQILKTLTPGAIVLPRITDPESAAAYVTELRPLSAGAHEALQFIIGADLFAQERFAQEARVEALRVPAMLTIAAAGASRASEAVFRMMADNLYAMGFDFQVGPSLALAASEDLGGYSLYSFGEDPRVCAALAVQINEAMQARGIDWMPAAYPGGQGRPPVLVTPRSQLRNRDLLPYADVTRRGVRMLNVGTALVPTLDQAVPACLSPIVMNDIRNDVLGFKGLIVAGPIDAPEIRSLYSPEEAAVRALVAGADMMYWNRSGPNVAKAVAAIVDGLEKRALDDALVERALTRIREFKKSLPPPRDSKDVLEDARKLRARRDKSAEPVLIEQMAITLLKNGDNVLPLDEARSQPVAVIGSYGTEELQEALEDHFDPIAQRPLRTARHATRLDSSELTRVIKLTDSYRTIICLVTGEIEMRGQRDLIRSFKRLGKQVVAVMVGYPRDLAAYQDADALLLAYGNTTRMGDTMTALADVLVGNGPVEILPPLRELTLRVDEETTFDVNDVIRSPTGRLPVTFDPPFVAGFAVSYRPMLDDASVRWDFGDGAKASTLAASHAFKKPGNYAVTLTVTGKKKDSVTGVFQVRVQ